MLRQFDHRSSQEVERPALPPLRRVGAGGRRQQRRLLAGQLAWRTWARFLSERQLQIAFHEAPFGSVHRGPADRDAARDRLLADTGVGGQQDLRPLDLARRLFAAAQHRRELRAFRLAQFHPVPYIHRWSPIVEGNNESIWQ
jgi:hypothetical protein